MTASAPYECARLLLACLRSQWYQRNDQYSHCNWAHIQSAFLESLISWTCKLFSNPQCVSQ